MVYAGNLCQKGYAIMYVPEAGVIHSHNYTCMQQFHRNFDLGVSQLLEIELATDPETGEYIAKMIITRLTGTLDAWLRLNGTFVAAIRRRFLLRIGYR